MHNQRENGSCDVYHTFSLPVLSCRAICILKKSSTNLPFGLMILDVRDCAFAISFLYKMLRDETIADDILQYHC